ncbi:Protein farnesyltransferase subunit beta [Metarhizium anisopliae]|nr:Protein farnesyltransferase subunit beta [Metarhizium anisopliae]
MAAMAAPQPRSPVAADSESRESSLARDEGHVGLVPSIPGLFTSEPPIRDALATDSSQIQDETVEECMPFLTGYGHDNCNAHGIPPLLRDRHVKFLQKQLGSLPSMFKAVLSLALVGGDEAYELVDRRSMWKWLCSLKQPDGGFQMAVGGEEDVRGAYCASVLISLLNIPLDLSSDSPACSAGHTDLFGGLPEWVGRCQTYEGGVSASPGFEAHGAYAFCALGCLSILDSPHRTIPKYLDVPRLLSWLSSRQYAPEGGFSGRTNKLVDGCYSHWVGGCWPLIEASLRGPEGQEDQHADHPLTQADNSLFSRNGLIRYIFCCCQDLSRRGGLRDKPSKYSDAYHTCYVLSGLSSAQHKWTLISARVDAAMLDGDRWSVAPFTSGEQIFEESDRVETTHPVYVIPQHKVDACQQYFTSRPGF